MENSKSGGEKEEKIVFVPGHAFSSVNCLIHLLEELETEQMGQLVEQAYQYARSQKWI
ncbi:MAG: hypothetical protein AAGA36_00545 [Pseudomonadota bacterium]